MSKRGLKDEEERERKCPLTRIGLGGTQSYLNTPGGPRPQWMAGDAGRSFAVRHPHAQRRDPRKHPRKGGFGGTDLRPTAPTTGYGRQPTDAYSRLSQRPKINLNGKLYTEGNFCSCYHKCCDQHEVISRIGVEKWRSSSHLEIPRLKLKAHKWEVKVLGVLSY